MNVILTIGGQIEIDHQTDLLHVDPTRQEVRGNQHTAASTSKFAHNDVTFALIHVSVHAAYSKVALLHVFLKPVHLATRVAVDNGLGDGQRLVQIAQGIELPIFAVHRNVELFDSLQGKLVLLHENSHGFAHKPLRHLQYIERHGRAEQADLHRLGQKLENVINLILKSTAEHFIGLIQKKLSDVVQAQGTPVDHVVHAPGRSHHNVYALLEGANVIADGRASHTGVYAAVHVVR
mmetsp:Transcript_5413/g.7986  ORF Transcript_5413/g.7986 Transcript_5413/m.7986 type:complete len:235 (+) Transcript_5413:227-931(+)